jgi:hypothetical protein
LVVEPERTRRERREDRRREERPGKQRAAHLLLHDHGVDDAEAEAAPPTRARVDPSNRGPTILRHTSGVTPASSCSAMRRTYSIGASAARNARTALRSASCSGENVKSIISAPAARAARLKTETVAAT